MLTSISPAKSRLLGGAAATQLPLSKEEAKAEVERARKRLFGDELFQQNESFRRMVTFANNPVLECSLGAIDPLVAAIKLLPMAPRGHREAGSAQHGFSGDGSSRSPFTEAPSLPSLSRALSVVIDDPTVRSRYDKAGYSLQEYAERRGYQQQQQQRSRGVGLLSTASPLSMSSVSPFALELAARNSIPKRRSSLSKMAKTLMREWFEENLHHPYPTEEEKEWLASQGGISLEQVNNWFINTRGRKWKPMLNRLMAEKQAGDCKLYDKMVEKIEEPYHREF
ncbi:hypothetical protein PHYBOEH_004752 [Phytophthora boehmeriae]|uniref:Homeobox domain-containing protein n=1 Tax=Phytophthora boehmeriae TaxID=109152 RepID=A0A8T1X426_9STRA|nr:hypothetical protein PHYBOEH_004752 [Phytophthora boehmeriae]